MHKSSQPSREADGVKLACGINPDRSTRQLGDAFELLRKSDIGRELVMISAWYAHQV